MADFGRRGRGAQSSFRSRTPLYDKSCSIRGNRGRGSSQSWRAQTIATRRTLDLISLRKLADESTEPTEIIRQLSDTESGLAAILESRDFDYLELIFVVMGNFCRKNGPTQFTEGFVEIVRTMGGREVFQHVTSVVLHLPNSRPQPLNASKRLKRLIEALYYLSIEILVMLPSFACTFLGKNFFKDLQSLKDIPSIKLLCSDEPIFDILSEGVERLDDAWNRHAEVNKQQGEAEAQYEERIRRQFDEELLKLEKPPDDFRKISVMPSWEDLQLEGSPFLRPSIIEGQYPDAETYLDTQFRLLREDFVYPLRIGIQEFQKQVQSKQKQLRIENVKFYYDVCIEEQDFKRNRYTLNFSKQGLRNVNWEGSKRLMIGSLLCLTRDDFKSILFFTVAVRNVEQLAAGKIIAQYEGGKLPGGESQGYLMAESSVYFEAYRSILVALQRINPIRLPLADYLLGKTSKATEPVYLADVDLPIYDLSSVPTTLNYSKTNHEEDEDQATQEGSLRADKEEPSQIDEILLSDDEDEHMASEYLRVDLRDVMNFPSAEELNLDPSQRDALHAALTRKVAIIQGPPGTGKTYVGLKIVQVLLDNRQFWTGRVDDGQLRSPILVICNTNHALDQFLEGILAFTRKIVRIGGQSKCRALEPFMLYHWSRRRGRVYDGIADWLYEIRNEVEHVSRLLMDLRGIKKMVSTGGIVHERCLQNLHILPKDFLAKLDTWTAKWSLGREKRSSSALAAWLGVYSSDVMDGTIRRLLGSHSRAARAVKRKAEDAPRTSGEGADAIDQWDREDVEEQQGQRMVVGVDEHSDDEDLGPRGFYGLPTRGTSDIMLITCGFEISKTRYKIKEMEQEMASFTNQWDIEWAQCEISQVENQVEIVRRLLEERPSLDSSRMRALCRSNLNAIPLLDRWSMYNTWKQELLEKIATEECQLEERLHRAQNNLAEARSRESAEICRPLDIVGFTTSGAAKQRALIDHLKPKIVIVEEAAQVLEAHVVTSLSSSCQHLILIGDHQQLKPSTTVYHLAKDYHLDVSLFERLVRKGMEPSVLGVQHRMRPEVARLIVPAIYPQLENHESVLQYPLVGGMENSVFFLAHKEMETEDLDGRSHSNPYEAELALALARYLLHQGFSARQITILTTYSGQLLYLRKLRKQVDNQIFGRNLRIAVVDNFQGEENEVIILSLVRSNEEDNIGFLRIENRICVALSRAKQGFYLIGNMEALQGRSKLWNNVRKVLESHGQIGSHFRLKCPVHDIILNVNQPEDFPPEGGCFQKCSMTTPCGHVCPQLCHAFDREHARFRCRESCMRTCSAGHPCPKKCGDDCHPCRTKVDKLLPCHHQQTVDCYTDPAATFCYTNVWKDIPSCGHRQEMFCSLSPEKAICTQVCGLERECGHVCPLSCHIRIEHQDLPCKQPCLRTCSEGHPCPKKCFEECGSCLVPMRKTLHCDHQRELPCYQSVNEVYCSVVVEKTLICQHKMQLECSRPIANIQCKQICDKVLCNDEHRCQRMCYLPCAPCNLRVDRLLSCGHVINMRCATPPSRAVCRILKKCTFPDCGHKGRIHCGVNVEDARCLHPCDRRLDCGHNCTERCHVKTDPDHEHYQCKKPCQETNRNCHRNHRCGKKCYEECELCPIPWKRKLPCGHHLVAPCHLNDEDIFCKEIVRKQIPDCGHFIEAPCGYKATRSDCKEHCSSTLECGHCCTKMCRDPCDPADCEELVKSTCATFCGHPITVSCRELAAVDLKSEQVMKNALSKCNEPCRAILPCDHLCPGTCGSCFNGRVHVPCKEKCGRILVCGHSCNVNCTSSCPPCQKTCEFKCRHSKCNRKCCEPCAPCKEPCRWQCAHYTCSRLCYEPCDRPQCNEPCPETLPCGHPCVGLCGELCPPLCRICNFDQLTEYMFSMSEDEPDARFVYLPDCGHTIEVSALDRYMSLEDDENGIQLKRCLCCNSNIISCLRYGNIIKKNFEDIVLVKRKILNLRQHPQQFIEQISSHINKIIAARYQWRVEHPIVAAMTTALDNINRVIPLRQRGGYICLDGDQRHRWQAIIQLMLQMTKLIQVLVPRLQATTVLKCEQVDEILDHMKRLLISLMDPNRLFSNEEFRDFSDEIERLDLIRAYYLLTCSPVLGIHREVGPDMTSLKSYLIEGVKKLTEERKAEVKKLLEATAKVLSSQLGISNEERIEIVKAMGMKQGHWFKCPNGHVYAIGNCGGAMEEGNCSDCGARIGGTHHRTRTDNQLATEMDGATSPAWPGSIY